MTEADETVRLLAETLDRIAILTPVDRAVWESDELTRLAVERLWITAGNLAEAHRLALDLPTGVHPWAEIYGLRNVLAHALPGDIVADRLWHETIIDLPRLRDAITASGN